MEKKEAKKVVEIIKEKNIKPEKRFWLSWKSHLFWVVWFLMLLFGALFFSLIIFNFMDFSVPLLRYLGVIPFLHWIFVSTPIFWLLLSLGAVAFGFLAFRKTKRGYRYSLLFVTSVTVLIVSVLGTAFHFSKINDRLQGSHLLRSPKMREVAFPIEGKWKRPEKGFLAGRVERVDRKKIYLEDMAGNRWEVYYFEDTKVVKIRRIEKDLWVGVLGKKKNSKTFHAKVIGPFPGKGCDGERRFIFRK